MTANNNTAATTAATKTAANTIDWPAFFALGFTAAYTYEGSQWGRKGADWYLMIDKKPVANSICHRLSGRQGWALNINGNQVGSAKRLTDLIRVFVDGGTCPTSHGQAAVVEETPVITWTEISRQKAAILAKKIGKNLAYLKEAGAIVTREGDDLKFEDGKYLIG